MRPKARRTALDPTGPTIKASVTAAPEDGKANAALIALLAEEWHLPKSVFAVVRGAAARDKVLSVAGAPDALAQRILDWSRAHD